MFEVCKIIILTTFQITIFDRVLLSKYTRTILIGIVNNIVIFLFQIR